MKRKKLLIAWIDGIYDLGWRGWLAMKILNPVLNEILAKENNEEKDCMHPTQQCNGYNKRSSYNGLYCSCKCERCKDIKTL